jgi:hypothetical protein
MNLVHANGGTEPWERLLSSTLAIATLSSYSRSSLSRSVLRRTSALTLAPRVSKALVMRPPRLPVASATTMAESFMIPILERGWRRCKVGADPSGSRPETFSVDEINRGAWQDPRSEYCRLFRDSNGRALRRFHSVRTDRQPIGTTALSRVVGALVN